MKYEFGIMSTRFSLEAEDDITAYTSMAIYFHKNIPIAVYKPKKHGFMPKDILDANVNKFHADKVKKCLATIKELQNGEIKNG